MKFCLVAEAHPGLVHEWDRVEICRIESEFGRQLRVFLELRALIRFPTRNWGMQIPGYPAKFTGNIFLFHNLLDFVDRGHACVPGSFCMLFSEIAYQFMQPFVCDTG